jgi:hypothetical protein
LDLIIVVIADGIFFGTKIEEWEIVGTMMVIGSGIAIGALKVYGHIN